MSQTRIRERSERFPNAHVKAFVWQCIADRPWLGPPYASNSARYTFNAAVLRTGHRALALLPSPLVAVIWLHPVVRQGTPLREAEVRCQGIAQGWPLEHVQLKRDIRERPLTAACNAAWCGCLHRIIRVFLGKAGLCQASSRAMQLKSECDLTMLRWAAANASGAESLDKLYRGIQYLKGAARDRKTESLSVVSNMELAQRTLGTPRMLRTVLFPRGSPTTAYGILEKFSTMCVSSGYSSTSVKRASCSQ